MGRPSTYTPEKGKLICERLAKGETLTSICRDPGMPDRGTVADWVIRDEGGFYHAYTRARECGLDVMAEELIALCDTPVIGERIEEDNDGRRKVIKDDMLGHRRLQIDTRKWYLSKLAPKRFGDKASVEVTGADGGPVRFSDTQRAARISALLAAAKARRDAKEAASDESIDDLV